MQPVAELVLLPMRLVAAELVLLSMRLAAVELVLLMRLAVAVATILLPPRARLLHICNSTTRLVTHLEIVLPIPLPMPAMRLAVVAVDPEFREVVAAPPATPPSQTL
jgi:hypothetical protein